MVIVFLAGDLRDYFPLNVEHPHPIAATMSSTFLRRLSSQVSIGIYAHSAKSAFVSSATDVGKEDLAHSQHLNFIPKVIKRAEVRVQATQGSPHRTGQTTSLWSWLCT